MLNLEQLAPERLRPLTRAEYDRLVETGTFQDERVELLYGMLVAMSPQNPGHSYVIQQLTEVLSILRGRAVVRVQLPLALGEESEPEPDVVVSPKGDYSREHPKKALLVVEVAESSLTKDRKIKGRLYAESGVLEYWVVNVAGGTVERYTQPQGRKFGRKEALKRSAQIRLAAFPEIVVRIADILPPLPGSQ
jgi:Uma2 family endonuclease